MTLLLLLLVALVDCCVEVEVGCVTWAGVDEVLGAELDERRA